MHICTNCHRCTWVCPVGINLQEIWEDTRKALASRALPEFALLSPLSVYDRLAQDSGGTSFVANMVDNTLEAIAGACHSQAYRNRLEPIEINENGYAPPLSRAIPPSTFSNCYRCMTCSSSCPVVRNYQNPMEALGLMPHQLMHAVGLGLWDLVFSSRMLWDCLGCYQCQQHCPMGVNVTDIIYELKHQAILRTTNGNGGPS
jgi:heterodisulfide reductase subunit C